MSETINERLMARGIELPDAPAPAAAYVPYVISGATLYISGQLPMREGQVNITGQLAGDEDIEAGQQAAELCAINILAQANAALNGDMDRITRLIKLQGFVASTPDFHKQHLVINGASNLLADILGERGAHARAAVGMAALPFNASVEIDAIFEIGSE
ncbi:RidA family protein [Hoeflea prorocentri]|uniref:RidA family protein n=1 Tax=Hoeflea prorocentri TaxID=1922333 RepID=A0A9X3UHJ5_9HYPH|nr:RidA family protein [Hoeflea prorocentri]MCY6380950.1 RidA family protein [Hoeflea prorocentri]MDA5398750.1 RidA family protein [Hoeflea prorocentri]